jgi:hypothetical protein
MSRHIKTLIAFALVSFYFLTTDVLLCEESSVLLGENRVLPLYAFAMLLLGAGFALFSALYKVLRTPAGVRIMTTATILVSTASLFGFILTESNVLFLLFASAHMLATGLVGGGVHCYAALSLRERTYTGRVVGLAIGLAALLQVLSLSLFHPPLSQAIILTAALGAVGTAALVKPPYILAPARKARIKHANKPEASYLALTVCVVGVMSLMGGLNDGVIMAMQARDTVNMYAYPRLFYLAGVIVAGFIADFRSRRYLPLAVLAVMVVSPAGVLFLNDSNTYSINLCIFSLFAGFAILYFTVVFLDIAPLTARPAIWAGMGRIVRFFFIALGPSAPRLSSRRFPSTGSSLPTFFYLCSCCCCSI